jgi:hypothetical protein
MMTPIADSWLISQDIQIEVNANTEGEFVLRDVTNEYYVLAKNSKYVIFTGNHAVLAFP